MGEVPTGLATTCTIVVIVRSVRTRDLIDSVLILFYTVVAHDYHVTIQCTVSLLNDYHMVVT